MKVPEYFGFVNENKDILLSDGNVSIKTAVSPKPNEIFCSNFQEFFSTNHYCYY